MRGESLTHVTGYDSAAPYDGLNLSINPHTIGV